NPGLFVIRFPSSGDPGDAGWHIDGRFDVGGEWWVNLWSRGRALLMLFLFTDVGPDDAPTRIYIGSHMAVPPILEPMGERGTHFENVVPAGRKFDKMKGGGFIGAESAGFFFHPFLFNTPSVPHPGTQP